MVTETKYEEKLKTTWISEIYISVRFITDDVLMNSANPFVLLLFKYSSSINNIIVPTACLNTHIDMILFKYVSICKLQIWK